MKVVVYGNSIFSEDILWGFRQTGCEATAIHIWTAKELEKALEIHRPDILFTAGAPLEFGRDVLEFLGKRERNGMKHIHWDTDGISSRYYMSVFGDGIEMDLIYISKPDLVFTMCPEMLEFMRGRGVVCEFMHYGYCPAKHHPVEGIKGNEGKIILVGNSYYSFARYFPEHFRYRSMKILIKPLLENGYSVHFYGDEGYRPLIKEMLGIDVPAEYFHGYLPYDVTCLAYNSSYINLVTQNHDNTVTKRTFEILGSGGFALSSDNAGVRALFTPGRDLAVSSSPEQTLELVRHYTENKEEWLKVRQSAPAAVAQHTYKQRAEFVLEKYAQYFTGSV